MKRATCQKLRWWQQRGKKGDWVLHTFCLFSPSFSVSLFCCQKINYASKISAAQRAKNNMMRWWQEAGVVEKLLLLLLSLLPNSLSEKKQNKWFDCQRTILNATTKKPIQAKHKIESSKTDEYQKHISSFKSIV